MAEQANVTVVWNVNTSLKAEFSDFHTHWYRQLWEQFPSVVNPLLLHLLLNALHCVCVYIYIYINIYIHSELLESLVGDGCAGIEEGELWVHSQCLMNEGCLWLLGQESSFNMSSERRPGRLCWSRVGRYVRDSVWQGETVGHRQEWWPWRTRIHWLPLGNAKLSISCACDYTTHTVQIQAGIMTAWILCVCVCVRTFINTLF